MQILWQMYPVLVLQLVKEGSAACSEFCACRWKNGKQTVECENKNLSEIPEGLDPETQVLDFSGNRLNKLGKELFLKKQLVNLQRVYLSNCRIKSVHRDTFKGLTNLVELDLSDNILETVPSGSFLGCPSLMKLLLNSNPITSLKKASFEYLGQLNNLELSNCKLTEVEEGAFQGMHSLEWLFLANNQLKTIPGRRTIPDYIKGVDLEKNPWECDCHLTDLAAWLRSFKSLLAVDPVCSGPPRLARQPIKSIAPSDLACLPSVSPTSFYLELGEGKNVSLLCHVHAVPEASVSWWMDGEMLRNDTMVAPGVHLIYYVEEGTENKRSELFIYNANSDDNGTFVCNADNPAGTAQANFTIRIVLKENPIVIIVSFPLEYVLCAVVGLSVLGLLVLVGVTVMIVKCRRRDSRRRKLEKTEEMVIQYQHNGGKLGESVKSLSDSLKHLNTQTVNRREQDMTAYEVQSCEMIPNRAPVSPSHAANQVKSPASLRGFPLEQNPDIINGCRREGDGEDHRNQEVYKGEFVKAVQFPIARLRESTEILDGGRCIVDPEGYPIDFGLPKVPCRTQMCEGYYRTLPSNRMKRHSAANPFRRISREAEFLSRSVDSPYENQIDVRYTADGYPAKNSSQGPSHQRENMVDPIPTFRSVQWPTYVPANIHVMNPSSTPQLNPTLICDINFVSTKRSASAQTDESDECAEISTVRRCSVNSETAASNDNSNNQMATVNEVLTESPDEGYEGEPSVV
ncbi:uncharacterized protein [Leptinotarsa decemlineata]|uniref:uncharacterized protein n=1 Tax=Leptinotarsa decemlineata TaxID=7539 RepID=UPI003D3079C4